MTENHESLPEPGDDPILGEALSHLKRLEPPLESRVANRMAVATALDELNAVKQRSQLPWWRRSIAVPVPVAACAAVVAAIALASSFRDWQERPKQVAESGEGVRDKQSSTARRTQNAHAELKFYKTETYLCGIGRVSSESHYSLKE